MTKTTLKLTALVAALAAVPMLALAQLEPGTQVGTDEAAIRAMLEAEGLEVLEIEIEDGEIEVDYRLDGIDYEAEIDAATGTVTEVERDDDEEEGDDDDA